MKDEPVDIFRTKPCLVKHLRHNLRNTLDCKLEYTSTIHTDVSILRCLSGLFELF